MKRRKMKKSRKFIIGGVSLVILGAIIGIIGLETGASLNGIVWKDGGFKTSKVIREKRSFNTSINDLMIDAKDVDIVFKKGKKFEVSSQLLDRKMDFSQKQKRLNIKTGGSKACFSVGQGINTSEKIVVSLTSEKQLKQLKLKVDGTNIKLNHLLLQSLDGVLRDSNLRGDTIKVSTPLHLKVKDGGLQLSNLTAPRLSLMADDSSLLLSKVVIKNEGIIKNQNGYLRLVEGSFNQLTLHDKDSTLSFKDLSLKEKSQWQIYDSSLSIKNESVKGVQVDGKNTELQVSGEKKSLPYDKGEKDRVLVITSEDSSIKLE